MKKKSLILTVVTIALCVSLIAGATFALFTSESKVNVAIGSANVKVVATVEDVVLDTVLSENLPETGYEYIHDDTTNTLTLDKIVPGDFITFNIRLTNESNVTVHYRTVINLVDDNGLWSGLEVTIDGSVYDGAETINSAWTTVAPGNSDIIIPVKVSLPKEAGNEYINTKCTFSYTIECVQGNADPSEVYNP